MKAKKVRKDKLEKWQPEIEAGNSAVFIIDECHLSLNQGKPSLIPTTRISQIYNYRKSQEKLTILQAEIL